MEKKFAWLALTSESLDAHWSARKTKQAHSMSYATPSSLKLSTAICFFLLSFALISVWSSPVREVETSIYTVTPPIFWLATILGILNGMLLFYYGYENKNKMWAFGLFQIILCNFLIISLPALRGYFFLGRFDGLSYIGYARDISIYGLIPDYNFYPTISLLLSSAAGITNLEIINIAVFLPAFFFAFYILSVFVWSKSISRDPKFVTSMMFAAMPIFYAWFIPSLYHHTLCVLMLPFFFFLLQKGKVGNPKYGVFRIFTFVLIVLLLLMHPLVLLGVLIFLITILIVETLTKRPQRTVSAGMVGFSFVVFFSWILHQYSMVRSLRSTIYQMLGMAEGKTTLSSAVGMSSMVNPYDFIQQLLFFYLDDLLFYILAISAAFLILRKKRWKAHPMTVTFACFVVGTLTLGFMIATAMIHNPFRLINLNFAVVLTIPLVGYMLYSLRKGGRARIARILTILVVASFVTSVFAVYLSPLTLNATDIATRPEVSGMDWFGGRIDTSKNTTVLETVPYRYSDLLHGHLLIMQHPDTMGADQISASSHFDSILSSNQSGPGGYVIVTDYDIEAFTKVWDHAKRFNLTDFQALSNSSTTAKFYDNGDLRLYFYR